MRIVELHAPVKPIQRRDGHSSTKAAAYMSGTLIHDERTGMTHNYTERTRQNEIEHEATLLPDNAPEWAYERPKLWNAVEKKEKHPRAQPARTLVVAMPYEFSEKQRRLASYRIAEYIVSKYGVATDMGLHRPGKQGDERNYHLHIVFAGRKFDDNRELAKTKDRTLDQPRTGRPAITEMRAEIADIMNDISARENLQVYVEHLSFDKRGLDKEPTQHMGQIATQYERQGKRTRVGDHNRAVNERNAERGGLYKQINERHKRFHHEAWEPFYERQMQKRREHLAQLDANHNQREAQIRNKLVVLNRSIDNAGIFSRFIKGITGRTAKEKAELEQLAKEYDRIQEQRRAAAKAFEAQRLEDMRRFKAAMEDEKLDQTFEREAKQENTATDQQQQEQQQQHIAKEIEAKIERGEETTNDEVEALLKEMEQDRGYHR